MTEAYPVDEYVMTQLHNSLDNLEKQHGADFLTIVAPIVPGFEVRVRNAIEKKKTKRDRLAIILQTPGGVVEAVARMVDTIRHHYKEVDFIVPDQAMSAGTVFVMSGDRIFMDYFSCLGPIDPQIEKDGKLVPALSYLSQFKRLNEKAEKGQLTTAEYALIDKMDPGDLYRYEEARKLSVDLLRRWLSKYKFRKWDVTETRKIPVTQGMREERAKEIAEALSNNEHWHSHGFGISMEVLRKELNLKIEDMSENPDLRTAVRTYHALLGDYLDKLGRIFFLQTLEVS